MPLGANTYTHTLYTHTLADVMDNNRLMPGSKNVLLAT